MHCASSSAVIQVSSPWCLTAVDRHTPPASRQRRYTGLSKTLPPSVTKTLPPLVSLKTLPPCVSLAIPPEATKSSSHFLIFALLPPAFVTHVASSPTVISVSSTLPQRSTGLTPPLSRQRLGSVAVERQMLCG